MTPFPISPARMAAHRVLLRTDAPKAPGLDILLEEQAERLDLDNRDLGLARQIVWGTLRHRFQLEHLLDQYLQRPLPREDVQWALLAAGFQHCGLERIPPHAIVSETVELVRGLHKGERFAGLANAILRKLTRTEGRFKPEVNWHRRCSIPRWLTTEAARVLPETELESLFQSLNQEAPLCLRVRDGEMKTRQAEAASPPGCLILNESQSVTDIDGFSDGRVTVEDKGAQIACLLAAPASNVGSALDLCASPGGKTSHLADLLGNACRLVATDVSKQKLARMHSTFDRLRLRDRIETRLESNLNEGELFDFVLVDAPCSGLGTLRRHPEIRYRRSPDSVAELAALQKQILAKAASHVTPGGILAYTVCTWSKTECEDMVEDFMASHSNFCQVSEPGTPDFDDSPWRCGAGMWRTWTHRHGCDSFFVARMRREVS